MLSLTPRMQSRRPEMTIDRASLSHDRGADAKHDVASAVFQARGLSKMYRMGDVEVPALRFGFAPPPWSASLAAALLPLFLVWPLEAWLRARRESRTETTLRNAG
jgi:hypothetical protein